MKKVTVVTVCYNAENAIRKTIESVVNQTFQDFEYLVIDGASTDSTVSIIEMLSEGVDRFVSEPDDGIYQAMNKAIDLACGEWIIFMNAGDWFVDNNVLSDVFSKEYVDADFIYGGSNLYDGEMVSPVPVRPLSKMWQRICFSHQALFSKTALMKKFKFDVDMDIVADYKFYFNCYIYGHTFHCLDRAIAVISDGGVSSQNPFRRTWQRWRVVSKVMPGVKVNIYYCALTLWLFCPQSVRSIVRHVLRRS